MAFPKLNVNWLMSDEGEMLLGETPKMEVKQENNDDLKNQLIDAQKKLLAQMQMNMEMLIEKYGDKYSKEDRETLNKLFK